MHILSRVIFFSSAVFYSNLHALRTHTAVGISTIAGISAGYLGYKGAGIANRSLVAINKIIRPKKSSPIIIPEASGVITAIPAACATYIGLHRYTPPGRFTYIKSVIKKADDNLLSRIKLSKENEVHVLRRAGYLIGGESIPYTHACRELGKLDKELRQAREDIRAIESHAHSTSTLHSECTNARQCIRAFDAVISHNLGYFQLTDPKMYADLLKADAQLQQAHAQQDMAGSQSSMARSQASKEVRGWLTLLGKFGEGLGSKIIKGISKPFTTLL